MIVLGFHFILSILILECYFFWKKGGIRERSVLRQHWSTAHTPRVGQCFIETAAAAAAAAALK